LSGGWIPNRADVARAALLAMLTILLWCAVEDRWTTQSWQTPIAYLSDPEKGDGFSVLAGIRAARDGHLLPFHFTNVPQLGAPGVANWDDYPATEKPLFLLMGLLASVVLSTLPRPTSDLLSTTAPVWLFTELTGAVGALWLVHLLVPLS